MRSRATRSPGTAGLEIDFAPDSPTGNDGGGGTARLPNNLQNFPVLTSATGGASTSVSGTLDTAPGTYRVEFFANPTCDTGNVEGERYLGFTAVSGTDRSLSSDLGPTTSAEDVVTATATDPAGNTSEFSVCEPVITVTAGLVVNDVG